MAENTSVTLPSISREFGVADGIGAVPTSGTIPNSFGIAAPVAGLKAVEYGTGAVRKTRINFSSFAVATIDGTTNGSYGTAPIYTFPIGRIIILGCTGLVTFTTTTSGTLSLVTGQTFGWGIGTVAAAAAGTLATTSINISPGTAQSVSTFVAAVAATPPIAVSTALVVSSTAQFDGTSTAVIANLNIGTATDASHGTTPGSVNVDGYVQFTWINVGDY